MSKKKNRKRHKQQAQRAAQGNSSSHSNNSSAATTPVKASTISAKPASTVITTDLTPAETAQLAYVKSDVSYTLLLAGLIAVGYVVLYFVLERTSVGTQILQQIKL